MWSGSERMKMIWLQLVRRVKHGRKQRHCCRVGRSSVGTAVHFNYRDCLSWADWDQEEEEEEVEHTNTLVKVNFICFASGNHRRCLLSFALSLQQTLHYLTFPYRLRRRLSNVNLHSIQSHSHSHTLEIGWFEEEEEEEEDLSFRRFTWF